MLYIAISIVLYALIDNAGHWYEVWKYNRMKNIVKHGALDFDGVRYRITEI